MSIKRGRASYRGKSARAVLAAGICLLLAAVFLPPGAVAKDDDSGLRVRGDIFSEYTDNPFHYSQKRLDGFDDQDEEGKRYFGLEGTSDVVSRFRVRMDYRWDLRKKRKLEVSLNGSYYEHARNKIADYEKVSAGMEVDVTRRDTVELVLSRTFDRFKKNYKDESIDAFDHAFYDQTDALIGYTRKLGRKWYAGADFMVRARRFNDPFSSRDYDGDYIRARTSYALGKNIRAASALSLGQIDSATGMDDGTIIDRSYDETRLSQAFDLQLGHGVYIGLELVFRRRESTTGVEEDLGRFDRQDDYRRARLEIGKEWKNGLSLTLKGMLLDNDSDRIDPDVETDEAGYEESTVGIDISYEFLNRRQ